jgi:hypothetical protein
MTTDEADRFRARIEEAIARSPGLRAEWSPDGMMVTFPRGDDDGFDVLVEIGRDEAIVHGAGAHEHFSYAKEFEPALGFVRGLLSPGMRVRELRSGGSPYRWYVEVRRDGDWSVATENGLLFFNYFGKRSQRIYQNRHLPEPSSR